MCINEVLTYSAVSSIYSPNPPCITQLALSAALSLGLAFVPRSRPPKCTHTFTQTHSSRCLSVWTGHLLWKRETASDWWCHNSHLSCVTIWHMHRNEKCFHCRTKDGRKERWDFYWSMFEVGLNDIKSAVKLQQMIWIACMITVEVRGRRIRWEMRRLVGAVNASKRVWEHDHMLPKIDLRNNQICQTWCLLERGTARGTRAGRDVLCHMWLHPIN